MEFYIIYFWLPSLNITFVKFIHSQSHCCIGFIYFKCHDLLTHSMVTRHLGYLQFGTNLENAALNSLVHVLHMLGLYPRVKFLLEIFLSACY